MHAVGHVESHVNGIYRYFPFHRLAAYSRLGFFSRKLSGGNVPCWNRAEPFLCQPDGFFERDMSRYSQDGIVRCIKTVEKVFHFLQCSLSDVCNFLSDSRPAVWV